MHLVGLSHVCPPYFFKIHFSITRHSPRRYSHNPVQLHLLPVITICSFRRSDKCHAASSNDQLQISCVVWLALPVSATLTSSSQSDLSRKPVSLYHYFRETRRLAVSISHKACCRWRHCLLVVSSLWMMPTERAIDRSLPSRLRLRGDLPPLPPYDLVWYINAWNPLCQRFSNCGPRTTSGPRVLPLWSFKLNISPKKTEKIKLTWIAYHTL